MSNVIDTYAEPSIVYVGTGFHFGNDVYYLLLYYLLVTNTSYCNQTEKNVMWVKYLFYALLWLRSYGVYQH